MNVTARLNKLVELLARQHQPSAGNCSDAVGEALDRCLDESRGEDFHKNLFAISCACVHAREQGREIDVDSAFCNAGLCGVRRTEVEAFVNMTPEAQVVYIDAL